MKNFSLLLLFAISCSSVMAQDDGILISEARTAMEKYQDCATAVKVLNKVSDAGQKEAMFSYYMAKAYECVGDKDKALLFYKKYASQIASSPTVADKVADLSYQSDKNGEYRNTLLQKVAECKGFVTAEIADGTYKYPFKYSESQNQITFSSPENFQGSSISVYLGKIAEKSVNNLTYISEGSGKFINYYEADGVRKEIDLQDFSFEYQVTYNNGNYTAELRIKRPSANWVTLSGKKNKDVDMHSSTGPEDLSFNKIVILE